MPEDKGQGPNGRVSESNGEATVRADAVAVELERQAREVVRTVKEASGDLGSRVRDVMSRASGLWDEAHPGIPEAGGVGPDDDLWARERAGRWVERDFLVDPELPDAMVVLGVERSAVWSVEARERGERRVVARRVEPYTGEQFPAPGPILPPWDYDFPFTPDIAAGERRERIAGSEARGLCERCAGSGHLPCRRCEGRGFLPCPKCHGRARVPCRRCLGRGRIEDPVAARRAGAAKGYWQVQAERLAIRAGDTLADLSERLRQDYGVPLPPSAEWAPAFARTAETIPCPDCVNGTVACECGNGKRVCEACQGTSVAPCPACEGTGSVVRFQEVVRQFDTRLAAAAVPPDGALDWVTDEMLRRVAGEEVWRGAQQALAGPRPPQVPQPVWDTLISLAERQMAERPSAEEGGGAGAGAERRVIGRQAAVTRVPVARVRYAFAGSEFAFVAVGAAGRERFWADTFPPRWSRVGRFLKALVRDLQLEAGESDRPESLDGQVSDLSAYRARRESESEDGE